MDIKSRFLGTLSDIGKLKTGDLLIAGDGKSSRLVLLVDDGREPHGIVVKEWGEKSDKIPPYIVEFPDITRANGVLHLTGEITVEPINANVEADDQLPLFAQLAKGHLCLVKVSDDVEVEIGLAVEWPLEEIKVNVAARTTKVYCLRTGKLLEPPNGAPRIWCKAWRLTYLIDDKAATLCEFGPST
jgi:hypothetical protein